MTFKNTLKRNILNYPMLFPTALYVYDHIFLVIGNGYEWKNGQCVCSGGEGPSTPERAIYVLLEKFFTDHFGKYLKDLPKKWDRRLRDKVVKRYIGYVKQTMEWEKRMNDLTVPQFMSGMKSEFEFYPLSEYSLICNLPDDIKPDWLEAAERMYNVLIANKDKVEDNGWLPKIAERIQELKSKSSSLLTEALIKWALGDEVNVTQCQDGVVVTTA